MTRLAAPVWKAILILLVLRVTLGFRRFRHTMLRLKRSMRPYASLLRSPKPESPRGFLWAAALVFTLVTLSKISDLVGDILPPAMTYSVTQSLLFGDPARLLAEFWAAYPNADYVDLHHLLDFTVYGSGQLSGSNWVFQSISDGQERLENWDSAFNFCKTLVLWTMVGALLWVPSRAHRGKVLKGSMAALILIAAMAGFCILQYRDSVIYHQASKIFAARALILTGDRPVPNRELVESNQERINQLREIYEEAVWLNPVMFYLDGPRLRRPGSGE